MPINCATLFQLISRAFNCRRYVDPTDNAIFFLPFYLLPLEVRGHIVGFMEVSEIIQASLVSPKFREAVRYAKTKIDVFMYEKQDFDESDANDQVRKVFETPPPTIDIVNLGWPRKKCYIKFFWSYQKDKVDILLKGKTIVSINEDLKLAFVDQNIVIYNSNPRYSKLADYQFIFDIIFDTFHVNELHFGEYHHNHIMSKAIMFPLAQRYRNLPQHIAVTQSRNPGSCVNLTSEELSAFFNNLEVPTAYLYWKSEPDAKLTGSLKAKKIKLVEASWLSLENLLTMDCEDLTAHDTNLTAEDISSFVKNWQEGGFEKLEKLVLTHDTEGVDWSDALDEFPKVLMPVRWHVQDYEKELHQINGKAAVMSVVSDSFHINVPYYDEDEYPHG